MKNYSARLDEKPSISAECVFIDPIRDIAVLASPDGGEFPDEAEAYNQLVFHQSSALRVGDLSEILFYLGQELNETGLKD